MVIISRVIFTSGVFAVRVKNGSYRQPFLANKGNVSRDNFPKHLSAEQHALWPVRIKPEESPHQSADGIDTLFVSTWAGRPCFP